MAMSENTREKLVRAKKVAFKVILIAIIIFHVLVILPGLVVAVMMGEPMPFFSIIALSLIAWAVALGLFKLFVLWRKHDLIGRAARREQV